MGIILFILKGISGIFIQSIILREIFSTFFGNELSFSFVISFWLSGGAFGSYYLRRFKNFKGIYLFLTIFEAIFLVSFLIFLRIFSNIEYQFYISNLRFFIFSFFLSFFSGFFEGGRFILLSHIYREEKSSGKVYGYEGLGFLIGGFLFSFLLFLEKNIFFLIFLSLLLNLSTIFYFKKNLSFLAIFFLFFLPFPFSKKIDLKTYEKKYKNFKILEISDTLYNKLLVLKKEKQFILISNGFQEFSSQPDYFSIKNISFFSLAFSNKFEKIGILGNVEVIGEFLKYKVGEIYFFEPDRKKVEIIKKYFIPADSKNVIFVNKDIKRFLNENKISFDVFLITNSNPMSLKENYFITDEFFKKISNYSKNLVIVLPGNYDYLGKDILKIHSSIYRTCKKYFKNEIFIFTYPMIAVFSNDQIYLRRNFVYDREFFNENYLNYVIDRNKKNQYLARVMKEISYENNISNNFCLYFSIISYFSQTSPEIGNFLSNYFFRIFNLKNFFPLITLFAFLILLFPSPYKSIIFTNGFSSITFETIFLFLFQIYYGFVYGFISKIIGIFMAGISFGSLISVLRDFNKRSIFYSEIFHFIFYLFSFLLLLSGKIFMILIFISGFLTGLEFGIISFLIKKEDIVDITGKLYSLDLMGALISSLLLPLFFIPAFGIFNVLLLVSLLKLSNLLNLTFTFFK